MNLDANEILESFAYKMSQDEHKIKLIFVPEALREDLKEGGFGLGALLDWNVAKRILPVNAYRELIYLNSLSSIALEENSSVYENVLMSEKLTPMLGEALDIRQLWLSQAEDKTAFVAQHFPSEQSEFGYDQYRYEVQQVLSKTVNGLKSQMTFISSMYEKNIEITHNGRYCFVAVPSSSVEQEGGEDILNAFVKETLKAVLRKASIYHPEKAISKTSLFGVYLVNIL